MVPRKPQKCHAKQFLLFDFEAKCNSDMFLTGSVRFTFKFHSFRGQSSWRSMSGSNTVQQVGSSTDSRLRSIPVCAAGPDVNSFSRSSRGGRHTLASSLWPPWHLSVTTPAMIENTCAADKVREGERDWERERDRTESIELLKPHQQRASCFIDFPETASAVQQGQQKWQEKRKGKCPVPEICETLEDILSQQQLIIKALANRPHILLHLHLFVLFMVKI